jgi:hypothetical protein
MMSLHIRMNNQTHMKEQAGTSTPRDHAVSCKRARHNASALVSHQAARHVSNHLSCFLHGEVNLVQVIDHLLVAQGSSEEQAVRSMHSGA